MAGDPSPPPAAPEAFSDAVRGDFASVNNVALLASTLCSAVISLYADAAGAVAPAAVGYVALAGWLATLLLALYLAGRDTDARGTWPRIRRGVTAALARPAFAALVLLISGGAVFTAWSKTKAESGGLLASWLPELRAVREDTTAIRKAVTREVPPAEQLARLGYTMSKEDICRAITEGRVDAWRLMQTVGLPGSPVAVLVGNGDHSTCIEEALLARTPRHGRWPEILTSLPNPNRALDRLYASQAIGPEREEPIDAASLTRAAGVRGAYRPNEVLAPLLMYAVWGGDAEAVHSLLAAGADPNTSAHVELLNRKPEEPIFTAVVVTPLAESGRLRQTEIAAALRAAGARATVQPTRSRNAIEAPSRPEIKKLPSTQPSPSKPWYTANAQPSPSTRPLAPRAQASGLLDRRVVRWPQRLHRDHAQAAGCRAGRPGRRTHSRDAGRGARAAGSRRGGTVGGVPRLGWRVDRHARLRQGACPTEAAAVSSSRSDARRDRRDRQHRRKEAQWCAVLQHAW